ncbi:uncharacterized protein LOC112220390 isoform X3 [Oncorhynchus tshawytscha]|uniref:uncharacterized protein LOC112220390 isoform X3 n=1 Tax=Oncorhynchus tshawytscha TaxID=74940 RepID=UPI001C3D070C|nr:uncharacterized protein LOC112220390 isoform X3 [Oncorhynchus tshawytscha]
MYFSFILLIYVAGVAVKESCADLVPTPTILFSPGYINVATPVTIRCESPKGTECKFYKDHDPNPIRKLDYKQGACQFKLLWNEFKRWNKTEVDLSCVIVQNREGETIKTSKPSDARRLNVGDNGCLGRVAEEELQRKRSSAGEIFITCAVELVVEGEDTVTSQHSEPLGITIDVINPPGATNSTSAFSLITPGQEKTSNSATPQGSGTKFHVVISLGTCSLFLVLLAGCVLGVLQRKCGVQGRPVNTGSPPEQQDQNPPCVYSVITKPSRDEEEDTSLQYATVTYTGVQASRQYATVTSTGNQVEPGRTKIKFEIAGEYALLAES